jgi:hypothetical protein
MRKTLLTAVAATATLAAVAATVPAQADGTPQARHRAAPGYKVVASNLHNPRQIAFGPHGVMYVAEAGQGGDRACMANPEGSGQVCFGFTGSVMKVAHGHHHRVLTGLPSIGDEGTGASAVGPADLAVTGKHSIALTIGLGTDPQNRKQYSKRAQKMLGHLLSFDLRTKKHKRLGDIARHERKVNPVDNPDSNPTGLAKAGKAGFVVTDSGGNSLVRVRHHKVRGIAAFQDRQGISPVTGPDPTTYQSVPTDVVKGPDGAWYVSELTGFPFIPGAARIWRIVPGHKPHVFAKGLTNVTSLAFDGKKLYAVQLADAGLTGGPPGSLVRVRPGKSAKTVAGGLMFPYGVAIHRGAAYVSIGSTGATGGQVVKIPLG